jgi:hypothetical protein
MIVAKEGGTAGPPPAFLVPPVKPCERAYPGLTSATTPREVTHHAAPR